MRRLMQRSPGRAGRLHPSPIARSTPISSTASSTPACTAIRYHRGRESESPRQARLERDPLRPADHHGGSALMILSIGAILGWITLKGYWPYLWREWITSVDHKRIGVMYILLAMVMLLRGFTDAIMMRAQQAIAAGGAEGYLPPEHFDQIFSAHGTIMIFFMAKPFLLCLITSLLPLP